MRLHLTVTFLFGQLHNFRHFFQNLLVVFPNVRPEAKGTVFDSILCVAEIAAAAVPQSVKGTVTKQTAEGLRIGVRMTGEELAEFILKKIIMLFCQCNHLLVQRVLASGLRRPVFFGSGSKRRQRGAGGTEAGRGLRPRRWPGNRPFPPALGASATGRPQCRR